METSIFSYLTAKPSRNIIAAARQQLTIEWWEEHRHNYELFTSNAVIAEASQGDNRSAKIRLESLRGISILEITLSCQNIAEKIMSDTPMPSKAQDDALHVAISSYHKMNYLLTWNCRHLANAHLIPKLKSTVEAIGCHFPQICTPEELMEEWQ